MAAESLKKKLNKRSNILKPKINISPPMSSSPSNFSYRKFFIIISMFILSCAIILLSISSNIWYDFTLYDRDSIKIYTIEVVNEFPHDPKAFTQGLLYAGNDTLYESTGLYRQSSVRKVALQTGKVEDIQKMDASHFGEGLTLLGERLFQITWLQKTGFIYDRNNLSKFERFTHEMQDGWGLATDGKLLFGSDGTSALYQIDPITLKGFSLQQFMSFLLTLLARHIGCIEITQVESIPKLSVFASSRRGTHPITPPLPFCSTSIIANIRRILKLIKGKKLKNLHDDLFMAFSSTFPSFDVFLYCGV